MFLGLVGNRRMRRGIAECRAKFFEIFLIFQNKLFKSRTTRRVCVVAHVKTGCGRSLVRRSCAYIGTCEHRVRVISTDLQTVRCEPSLVGFFDEREGYSRVCLNKRIRGIMFL